MSHYGNEKSTRSPEEIRAEISKHKEEISNTIKSAKDSVEVDEVLNAGLDYVTHKSNELYQTSRNYVQQNPMAIGFAALGVASLFAAGMQLSKGQSSKGQNYSKGSSSRYGSSNSMSAEKMKNMSSEKMREWQDSLKDTAHEAQEKMAQTGQQVTSTFQNLTREYPILTACIGAAIGAAVGSALPRTQFEDQKVGPYRDKAVSKAQESAEKLMSEAKEAVGQSIENIEERLLSEPSSQQGDKKSEKKDDKTTDKKSDKQVYQQRQG